MDDWPFLEKNCFAHSKAHACLSRATFSLPPHDAEMMLHGPACDTLQSQNSQSHPCWGQEQLKVRAEEAPPSQDMLF